MAPARQRGTEALSTFVYQYGAIPKGPFPEQGIESLYKENKLWNSLVEIHNRHRESYEAARCAADSEYALISESIKRAEAAVEAAFEAKREARKQAGTRDASHPLIRAAIDEINRLKQNRRELWATAKAARKRADGSIDKAALNKAFRDAVNAAQRVGNTGGLNSTTANQVADNFQTARERAFKEGARLRFHAFDGTGYWFFRFRVKGSKVDGISYGELFSQRVDDGRSFVLTSAESDRKKPRIPLRVKVAGGAKEGSKVYAFFDLILHRPLPENAQVQNAKLIRKRNGDKFSYLVSLTVRVPRSMATEVQAAAIGVDIGFRQLADQRVRVAAIGGSEPEDECQIVEVSKEFIRRLEHVDALKASLDPSAEALGQFIKPLLKAGSVLPEDHPRYRFVRSIAAAPPIVTMSFEKAYKLARWLLREPGALPPEVEKRALDWWQQNGRRYRELHNLRQKALAARKEEYRKIAAKIVKFGRPIGVEMIDLRVFAEAKDRDNKLGNTARSNRFLVAPSELLAAIRNAATKAGLPFHEVSARNTSKTCSACGVVNEKLGAEDSWTCAVCGVVHDRDKNAAVNIARRAKEKRAPATEGGS